MVMPQIYYVFKYFLTTVLAFMGEQSRNDLKDVEETNKLPKPPVPDLPQTLKKYLEYAEVVVEDQRNYAKTKELVDNFAQNEGPLLQDKLLEISTREDNWINKYWLNDMYLNNRAPLPVYSNPGYILLDQKLADQSDQSLANLASCTIYGIYDFKNMVDNRKVPRDFSTGKESGKPLCMSQYWHLFTSYRHCTWPVDKLSTNTDAHLHNNEHIVIMYKNQAFMLQTVIQGEILKRETMAEKLLSILSSASISRDTKHPVSLLTAAYRDKSSFIWKQLLLDKRNRDSLNKIETSSFIICLDDISPASQFTENSQNTGDDYGHEDGTDHEVDNNRKLQELFFEKRVGQMLHGEGISSGNTANRWFDKTLQFILDRRGRMGFNYEHSTAEGIVIINLAEHVCNYVSKNLHSTKNIMNHSTVNPMEIELIHWNVSNEMENMIEGLKPDIEKFVRSVDFLVLFYTQYGRNFPKSNKISPDAYIQLVLQWTHYRCHGRLVSTYESAGLRRFRFGRVDNIRAATPEALAWVKIMEDLIASNNLKRIAFKKALHKHVSVMNETLSGFGIDNHLVALREICHLSGQPMPKMFTDHTFQELFTFPLSTSQVTTSIPKTLVGYGAVVDDGYGCGYSLTNDMITFTIASNHNCSTTDSALFRKTLKITLNDMKEFIENEFPGGVE